MYAGILALAQTNLAASCRSCGWTDVNKEATALAKEGKLFCHGCGYLARVVYIPPSWAPGVSGRHSNLGAEGIPEAVHEGVASGAEIETVTESRKPKAELASSYELAA